VVHADRFLLRFGARFAVLSAALLLLCWALPLLSLSENLVVATADQLLGLMEKAPVSHTMVIEDDGDLRLHSDTLWREGAEHTGRPRTLNYSHSLVHRPYYVYSHNLLVFLVLVLATPGLRWQQRCAAAVVGGCLILGLDAVILTADVWEVDRQYLREYFPAIYRHEPSGLVRDLVGLVRSLHPTGGAFMAPVFLWGLVLMSPVFAERTTATRRRRP
jgi:hypothetical protein